MSSFVADFLAGHASADLIDDYVERWHAQEGTSQDLHSFLGLSQEEYERWVTDPDSLSRILTSRSVSHPLWETLFRETKLLDALIAKLVENQQGQRGSIDPEAVTISILMTQALGVSVHSLLQLTKSKDLSIRDAYGISRSICELAVNICYVAATGERTARRAQHHALQKQYRSFSRSAVIGGVKIDLYREGIPFSDEIPQLDEALAEFTRNSGKEFFEWSEKDISGRISEIAKTNQKVAIALATSIFTVYRDASELLHGTYSSVLHFWSGHGAIARDRESFNRVWETHFLTVFTSSYFASQAVVAFFTEALELKEIGDAQNVLTSEIRRFSDNERVTS